MAERLAISFQGAARTVTGSRHHLTWGGHTWLFDCGLYQGHRDDADRVNRAFAFEPPGLDGVVLSHAHLDHAGNLPTLVKSGFGGRIHVTPASGEISGLLLADSAFLMERDLEHLRKHGRAPARTALFTTADVQQTVTRFEPHVYHAPWELAPNATVTYYDAGHILGSALTTFEFASNGRRHRLGMSGDLGRPNRRILRDPEVHPGVDTLVLESTYGDRTHTPPDETERTLTEIVRRTVARGGRVIVPAFALGRAQEMVATFYDLCRRGAIGEVPVYVDSPLARQIAGVFGDHPELFDDETRRRFEKSGAPLDYGRLRYVGGADESRALNDVREPIVVIAASGMCEGGRILHHLRHGLGNPRNTVLFVGFQAEGTLGRRLRDGAESVNIFGEPVRVAAEIVALDGFSAHADREEILAWVSRLDPRPRRIFLVHGEPAPAESLASLLQERLDVDVHVPEKGQEFELWS
jgi:metallo-beta-lactamase family protein